MKKMKALCLGLAFIIASSTISFADYAILHETTTTEPIGKGISYTESMLLTEHGWLPIRIIEGDLSASGLSLKLLTGDKANERAPLSSLVESFPEAVAAVNGDFFDTGLSTAMGPVVKDGTLISSSIKDPRFNTAWTDTDGTLHIGGGFEEAYTLVNRSTGKKIEVEYINKPYLEFDRAIVYDSSWEGLPPQRDGSVYIGVSDGRVASIDESASSLDMESLDYAVAACGTVKADILDGLKAKQRLEIRMDLIPSPRNLGDGFGGGSMLVENGEIPQSFSLPIPGRHPRTALGVNKNGNRFWLMTVDGRSSSAAGMTEMEVAEYMLELGAWNAINLDGGGSTEMIARRLGEYDLEIANQPSGSVERKISGGIAISSLESNGAPMDFLIDVSDRTIVLGASRSLDTKFFDANFNPVRSDSSSVKWSVEGNGSITGNRFYPSLTGTAIVTGTFNGISRSIEFTCIDAPASLKLSRRAISLDLNGTASLEARIETYDGYDVPVDFADMELDLPERLGSLKGNEFTASGKAASGKIRVEFQGLYDEIPVSIGYSSFVFNDFESKPYDFAAYPSEVEGDFTLDSETSKKGDSSGRLSFDFSGTDETRAAYAVVDHELYSSPSHIGLWVKGDQGGGHWLRVRLRDSAGKTAVADLARYVDWKGWEFKKAEIPAGLSFPVTLDRVYIVETDSDNKNSGSVWFDDLTAFYKTPFSGHLDIQERGAATDYDLLETAPEETQMKIPVFGNTKPVSTLLDRLVHIRLSSIAESADLAVAAGSLVEDLSERLDVPLIQDNHSYSATSMEGLLILKLNNSSGKGLRASDPMQIAWLREQLGAASEKNVLLVMSNPWVFTDPLEEGLILEWLEDYRKSTGGKTFSVSPAGQASFTSRMKNGHKILGAPSAPKVNDCDIFADLNLLTIFMTDDGLKYTADPIYKRP